MVQISTRPYLIQYRCFKIIRKDTFPISENYACIFSVSLPCKKTELAFESSWPCQASDENTWCQS